MFHPVVPAQHVHKRHGDARLACTRRHHQKPPPVHVVEPLAKRGHCRYLVRTSRYVAVYREVAYRTPSLPVLDTFQFFHRVVRAKRPVGIDAVDAP